MGTAREFIGEIPLPAWVSKCGGCDDQGHAKRENCRLCGGVGYFGVRLGPCDEPTGSLYRILVYRARRLAGKPMHHSKDTSRMVDRPTIANREIVDHWTAPEVHDPELKEQNE